MKLNVKKLQEDAKLPNYGTPGAACFDIRCSQKHHLLPGIITKVKTGLAFEVPEGHVMLLFGRSGHASRGLQLANCVGVIDSDYRGELIVMLRNDNIKMQILEQGDRCAQAMILPTFTTEFVQVGQLSETVRGEGGFGSTGNK